MGKIYDFSTMDFSQVCVIGSAGSGKTTLSKQLGSALNRPVTHLDKILWGQNWTELTREQQLQILEPIVEQEQWIIDGLWAGTLETRYQRATLVIFLRYKPLICVWRAFWRSVKHTGKQRDDLALGCVEKVNFGFYRYIWNFKRNSLPKIVSAMQSYPQVPVMELKTPRQTKRFLKQLEDYLKNNQ